MIEHLYLTIFLSAALTLTIKIFPLMALARRNFPIILRNWLSFVPTAILASIIAGDIIANHDTTSFGVPVAVLAAIISTVIGLLTRSLFGSVIASILAYLLFQNI